MRDPVSKETYEKPTSLITNMDEVVGIGCRSGNRQHQMIEGQVKVGDKWVSRSQCAHSHGFVRALVEANRNHKGKQVLEGFSLVRV